MLGGAQVDLNALSRRRLNVLILATFAVATLLATVGSAAASEEKWDWKDATSFQFQYEGGYDSNILELSDNDILRFEDNQLPLATKVETYDDLKQSFGIRTRLNMPKWWGWRDGSVSYTFRYNSYAKNPYNDRPIHTVYFTHDIFNRADVFYSHMYIPERYLRDYYDRDTGQVIGTQFDYTLGGGGLQYSPEFLKGLRLSARYEFFTIYYNKYFTEYDSEGWGLRFDARYKLNNTVTLTGILKRRWSDNTGFDEQSQLGVGGDPQADSEYGDGTYGEEWYELIADLKVRNVLPNRIDLQLMGRMRHRFYDTELGADRDPVHAGREHKHYLFSMTAMTKVWEGLRLGPVIEYELRRTDSPTDWVVEAKDFDSFRAMLSLSYSIW
jgi:hypothetical protein